MEGRTVRLMDISLGTEKVILINFEGVTIKLAEGDAMTPILTRLVQIADIVRTRVLPCNPFKKETGTAPVEVETIKALQAILEENLQLPPSVKKEAIEELD